MGDTQLDERERNENEIARSRALTVRRGAGGTPGGIGTFLIGLVLTALGGYLILNQVKVGSGYSSGYFGSFYAGRGGFGLTMLPLLIGIGALFVNGRSMIGWALSVIGTAIIVGAILMSMTIHFEQTSLYNVLLMFGMFAAGLGLIVRSLRAQ